MLAEHTDALPLACLTITSPMLPGELCLVNDTQDLVRPRSRKTFRASPFSLQLAREVEDQLPTARLTIENVTRELSPYLRRMTEPPKVVVEIVTRSQPDAVDRGPYEFSLREIEYNQNSISGTLRYDDMLVEPYGMRLTPRVAPGLFE